MIEEMYGWPFLTEFFKGSQEEIESQVKLTYTPVNITIDCSDPDESGHAASSSRNHRRRSSPLAEIGGNRRVPPGGKVRWVNGVITFSPRGLAFVCGAGSLKSQ